jgi:phosphoglycerol transferase
MSHFSGTKIDEIIFTIKAPLDGAEDSMINSFIISVLIPTLVSFVVYLFVYSFSPNILFRFKNKCFKLSGSKILLVLILALSLNKTFIALDTVNAKEYIENQSNKSTIYEEYYVNPQETCISFPDEKPNLIYIVLESMETTYASKNWDGAYDYNLIPNLTTIANNETSFSTSDNLLGSYITSGTGFTVGSLVAQTSGVPLKLPIQGNNYTGYGQFLPGVYSLGEILEREGYNQVFLLGSDANFGGRKDYFTYHGNYEIRDYYYAIDNNLIPNDYHVWWGYEDMKLFQFAKDTLLELSEEEQPFNLTLLTADTHHVGGYKCELCEDTYADQFSNVIACSDKQVQVFIDWIKTQEFYDNTVIIITGDHNSMDPDYFNNLPEGYRRAPYNAIINPQVSTDNLKNRSFCTMDWFPTTLGAMGVEMDGNRLGLGTNMFSEKETLMEELGTDYFINEIAKKSSFYDDSILYSEDN